MLINWLKWLHYTYIYAPKRMKTVQELREARRLLRKQRRYENQIREYCKTNSKDFFDDGFLLDELAMRIINKDRAFAKELLSRYKRPTYKYKKVRTTYVVPPPPPPKRKKDNGV